MIPVMRNFTKFFDDVYFDFSSIYRYFLSKEGAFNESRKNMSNDQNHWIRKKMTCDEIRNKWIFKNLKKICLSCFYSTGILTLKFYLSIYRARNLSGTYSCLFYFLSCFSGHFWDSKSKRDTKNSILVLISGNMAEKFSDSLCSSEKHFGLYFQKSRPEIGYFWPYKIID